MYDEYRLSGQVRFTVTTHLDDPATVPTYSDAIHALRESAPSHAEREFEDVQVELSSTASANLGELDGSPAGQLYEELVTLSEGARLTVVGSATEHLDETVTWGQEPSEDEARDILSDKAPCSVLDVDEVTVTSIEHAGTSSHEPVCAVDSE